MHTKKAVLALVWEYCVEQLYLEDRAFFVACLHACMTLPRSLPWH